MVMKKKKTYPLLGKLSPSTNELLGRDKASIQKDFVDHLEFSLAKDRYSATGHDFFKSLAYTVRDRLFERWIETHQSYYAQDVKRVYFISMEYMLGRLLGNAMLNLGITEITKNALLELGLDLEELQEIECDAGLGNGGLGRLAACFLDSMATLELPAYGYGIRYEYGIFSQKINNGYQVEIPDHWLRYGNPWEIERPEFTYPVRFYGKVNSNRDENGDFKYDWIGTDDTVAVAYDIPIPGFNNNTVNNLRLWSAKSSDEFNLSYFNHGDYDEAVRDKIDSEVISKVLYPRDDFIQGRELRLKQEYFLSSATLQDIIRRFKKAHNDFNLFPEKVVIQLNDTHPVLCIPELMRLLIDQEKIPWEKAWEITSNTFAYTNHTILQEALETWRVNLLEKILPRHLQIIYEINRRFLQNIYIDHIDDEKVRTMSIIEEGDEKRVRMANLAIVGSFSVNGVAALHSRLLKDRIFKYFSEIWNDKFNNKTNGITQRRWLKLCNPRLSDLITDTIGGKWITDLYELKNLEKYISDRSFQSKWLTTKKANKKDLAGFIRNQHNIEINVDSIFDCQIKRIHEYKRQLLNIIHVISIYNRLKAGVLFDYYPRTFIFSGKAAPSYQMAKLIVKLINNVAEIVNKDPNIGDQLKVIFLPDYSVSLAQRIIPAADISEQISTAGMEASGTGNMKFSLNGAVTIGTLDGANIEIMEEVGKDSIFIFGQDAQQVFERRSSHYQPSEYYRDNEELKTVIDMIESGFFSDNDREIFKSIINVLKGNDYFMVMSDFKSYYDIQNEITNAYLDKNRWIKMSIKNAAGMGKFSTDRTIQEYAHNIWKAKPLTIKLKKEIE
jgi:starch phosphorylase